MIHPEVRDIYLHLFNEAEKEQFLTALQLMVMFDIQLLNPRDQASEEFVLPTQNNQSMQTPKFSPDITALVTYSKKSSSSAASTLCASYAAKLAQSNQGGKKFMRLKTQILLLQNYEKVKQALLVGKDPRDHVFNQKLLASSKLSAEGTKPKLGMGGLSSYFKRTVEPQKKRSVNEISTK
uniref:Uncharacterized protein n=1 Tax=Strombidium rassoulzadegani TaxID=1082188 RepID=A0A7S3FX74_9SPIT|mmetsp:Transcript_6109/g.10369  ORF Transcript_6109/g.10369 Transcript_6109/m.10369 type:complete len:180 (+) Transcript_6109:129-668(+)